MRGLPVRERCSQPIMHPKAAQKLGNAAGQRAYQRDRISAHGADDAKKLRYVDAALTALVL